jgi:para-nitrobenzyl esterase
MKQTSRRALLRGMIGGGALVAGGALGVGCAGTGAIAASTERLAPIAKTQSGRVRGRSRSGVDAFLGIPYGGPTEGAGRFLPPTSPKPWSDVRDAWDCGPPCVQINLDLPAWVDPRPASENCLFLNVWAPRSALHSPVPVMVWVHGGAYLSGSGGLALYDGERLARRSEVVVITVNHRLNAFGYLYLGGLSSPYADSGNIGQLDLVAALRWVRDNIGGFGGDPDNVTVFGESGGGGKISALCGMPAAKGLFHKAIIESGSIWNSHSPQEATEVARDCLAELALSENQVGRLVEVPAERLVAAGQAVVTRRGNPLAFMPVVDGRSILEKLWDQRAPRQAAPVRMLIGTNSDEAVYFLDDPTIEPADDQELSAKIIKASPGLRLSADQARALIQGYRANGGASSRLKILVQIATDAWMWRNAVIQAERKLEQSASPVYMYEFSWKTPCFGRQWSPHGSEIPFVFGNLEYEQAWDKADTPAVRAAADPAGARYRLAETMMDGWAAFAHKGSPSTTLESWPAYDLTSRATMIFGAHSHVEIDPKSWQREMLKRILG